MKAFLVELENRPGEFARVTEAIARKGVNITAIGGAASGSSGRVAMCVDNESMARAALEESNSTFEEMDASEATLRNEPGQLAMAARQLADAGVNIEALMPTGMSGNDVSVAFVTNNATKANQALSGMSSARR